MLAWNRISRGLTRLTVGVALLSLCLASRTASAWTYPLLPHVQGLAFFPERPNDAQRTGFELSYAFPHECWQLVDAALTDSAHVRVTLAPASTCRDSGSTWTGGWDLGILSAGTHTLTVRATVENGTMYPTIEEITVPYDVAHFTAPPPPPPPPPPPGPGTDTTTTLVNYIEVIPGAPLLGDRVSVLFRGRFPFNCGVLSDSSNADPTNLSLTMSTAPGCGDTIRVWQSVIDLGIATTAGDHIGLLHIHVPSLAFESLQGFGFHVTDPNGPPPPPPPGPPPVDTATTLVNYVEVVPGAPLLGDRVSVVFRGRFPFDCGVLSDSSNADPANLSLTMSTTPGCDDSTRVWQSVIDLGIATTAGDHYGLLHIHVPSLAFESLQGFGFHVTDPNAPPPPPPIDSVKAGLSASAPNPFSVVTTFGVSLADPTQAEVAVFDLSGRRVTTIHNGVLPRGTTNLAWDGRRHDGSRAPGGIYFYRLTLPDRIVTRRVVLLGAP